MKEKLHFSETLKKLMEKSPISNPALGRAIGVSHVAIGNFLSGQLPKSEHLYGLARFFGVSTDYLLTGKDSGNVKTVEYAIKAEVPEPLHDKPMPRHHGGPYYGTRKEAPIISWASAGDSHAWEDQGRNVPHIPTICGDPNTYALEIKGDSMEPLYTDGDIAVVAPNAEARPGDLVIAKTMEDESYFKQVRFSPDLKHVRLFSFNPKYPMMELKRHAVRFLHPVFSVTRYFKARP